MPHKNLAAELLKRLLHPEPALVLIVKHSVKYTLTKEVQITKNFMKIFSDLTLGMLLWTYFRVYTNNTVY
jgi:hypothetical protein